MANTAGEEPRRPPGQYFLWLQVNRARIKATLPQENQSKKEIDTACSAAWKELPDSEKAVWREENARLKEQFEAYKEAGGTVSLSASAKAKARREAAQANRAEKVDAKGSKMVKPQKRKEPEEKKPVPAPAPALAPAPAPAPALAPALATAPAPAPAPALAPALATAPAPASLEEEIGSSPQKQQVQQKREGNIGSSTSLMPVEVALRKCSDAQFFEELSRRWSGNRQQREANGEQIAMIQPRDDAGSVEAASALAETASVSVETASAAAEEVSSVVEAASASDVTAREPVETASEGAEEASTVEEIPHVDAPTDSAELLAKLEQAWSGLCKTPGEVVEEDSVSIDERGVDLHDMDSGGGTDLIEVQHDLVSDAVDEDVFAKTAKGKKRGSAQIEEQEEAVEPIPPEIKKKNLVASEISKALDPFKRKQSESACAHKVCVKGLPWHMDEDSLRREFSECGEIDVLVLLTTIHDGKVRSKGIAFISFKTAEGMSAALEYDGTEYGGRFIKISAAYEREDRLKFQREEQGDMPSKQARLGGA